MPYEISRQRTAGDRDKQTRSRSSNAATAVRGAFAGQTGPGVRGSSSLGDRNQWEARELLRPHFHLDDENLDPNSMVSVSQIRSGGFRRELAELRER